MQFKPNLFLEIGIFCSGANQDYLADCPKSEHIKYTNIGYLVFFTGVFAFFSSSYALYTIFEKYSAAIVFAFFWGGMIFILDRYIVSSLRKVGNIKKEFLIAFPRFLLALTIAIVISHPLELRIFRNEIINYLVKSLESQKREINDFYKNETQSIQDAFEKKQADFKEIILNKKKEIKDLGDHKIDLEKEVSEAKENYLCEADGTCGSGKIGIGPIAKIKDAHYKQLKANFDNQVAKIDEEITQIKTEIGQLQIAYQNKLQMWESDYKNSKKKLEPERKREINIIDSSYSNSLLDQSHALFQIAKEKKGTLIIIIFITILFIMVETAPVFVKLISSKGPYDIFINSECDEAEAKCNELSKMRLFEYDLKLLEYRKQRENEIEKEIVDKKKSIFKNMIDDISTELVKKSEFSEKINKHLHDIFDKILEAILSVPKKDLMTEQPEGNRILWLFTISSIAATLTYAIFHIYKDFGAAVSCGASFVSLVGFYLSLKNKMLQEYNKGV